MLHTVVPVVQVIVKDQQNRVLIGKRGDSPNKPFPGFWDFPGGKIDRDANVVDAAKRELLEETGISLNQLNLLGVFHYCGLRSKTEQLNADSSLNICYFATVKATAIKSESDIKELCWVTKDNLSNYQLTPWANYFASLL